MIYKKNISIDIDIAALINSNGKLPDENINQINCSISKSSIETTTGFQENFQMRII